LRIEPEPSPVLDIPTDFYHEFTFQGDSKIKSVKLAGSFTGWKPIQDLKKDSDGNQWRIKIALPF
jgi:cupin superfamily acireductone dioxygenase involved in methionine salvage